MPALRKPRPAGIRETSPSSAERSGAASCAVADRDAAVEAVVRVPAQDYSRVGGAASWATGTLFRLPTGVAMASCSSLGPQQAPWDRPRFVTGGRTAGDPYEVELGQWVWEGAGSGDLEMLVTHAVGVHALG